MTYLEFASGLVKLSLLLAAKTIVLSVVGILRQDRRWVLSARRSQIAGAFTIVGAAACLVAGFFAGAYDIKYIFSYSEQKLAWPYKFAGLWAGLDGSILFWTMILGVIGAIVARGFRKDEEDPSGRRLEPFVYIVYAAVQVFFLCVISFVADPFEPMSAQMRSNLGDGGLVNGIPRDGSGLNPLLESYWMLIHPPSLYMGFILYTVPFAFGIAALAAGELSSYWIRKTRRWTLVAWLFNTNGVILGGLWAYEVLGWGGYWAWDPVENASLLPWLAGTAFVHSVMIQERRDMLRVWNSLLVGLTFILSIFGTYLTRSGIVSSVHAFASGAVGDWFLGFILLVMGTTLFLIVLRRNDLRSQNTIDSVVSREAVFLFNNLVLIAIAAAVVILTLWPKISHEFLGESITVGPPVYNLVCTPLFCLLLLFTAIGPGMAWVRTTGSTLRKNMLLPAVLSLPLAVGTQAFAFLVVRGGDLDAPVSALEHVYPTFVVVYLSWLILTTLGLEVWRGARYQMVHAGRSFGSSLGRMFRLNNRRYGGYIVHTGIAILAMGVVISSMYKVEKEKIEIGSEPGYAFGPYTLSVKGVSKDEPVSAYLSTKVHVDVVRDGERYAGLDPEKRFYPQTGFRREPVTHTEVSIVKTLWEDLYIYFDRAEGGGFVFSIFRNPLINLVWLGWLVMLAGGVFAALPLGRRRVGLAG